ncbi:MAG: FolC bifunctional protein [Desulfobacteraceae bacterium IS3]|nr:MAG: FolC bifunctional protein [Desulfobacteraceae bacterium IS3]
MKKQSYQECLETMYRLRRFGIILGLDTIRHILDGLKNPQDRFKTIHVAGTNGKGSISSALATILKLAGYKVGLYTSPHLVRFNERICINGAEISDENVVKAYQAVRKVHTGDREPTFFEFSTAMAFYEFGRQKVDWAVIETGMGGRMDATNIIMPEVSIISNISLEHQSYLGNTVSEIAGEKAGIIKKYIPVITGVKQKAAISALNEAAEKNSAPLYRFGKDFRVRRNKDGSFHYFGIQNQWKNMRTALSGSYQVDNAALVLGACEILNQGFANLSEDVIRQGLFENRWAGRLEVVSTSPYVILDGAHNSDAAKHLADFLSKSGKNITLVVGILDDKPYEAMMAHLLPVCKKVIITQPDIDRAMPPKKLYDIAKAKVKHVTVEPKVADAVQKAMAEAKPDEVICIAGSLYVVGEAKAFFESQTESVFHI